MMERIIASSTFSMKDQRAFGEASGDWNPVHVDHEYARRTMFGDVLVHGIHGMMWALDRHLGDGGAVPRAVRAQFAKPVFLGETVTLARGEEAGVTMLTVAADGVTLITIVLDPSHRQTVLAPSASHLDWPSEARMLDRDELRAREGTLPFVVDRSALRLMFPALLSGFGERASGTMALLSRLVGMECPGRQSILAGVSLAIEAENAQTALTYRVHRSEPAFAPVEMGFSGPDLRGTVSAFYRPPQAEQPSMAVLHDHVLPCEFASQRALVVGGSRGLGELTAKLLAAGGADVTITYAVGARDADLVREDIEKHGGRCRVHQLDVLKPGASLPAILAEGSSFNTAYYFATPRIGGRRKRVFEPMKLRSFVEYYIDAFTEFCLALGAAASQPPTVFYPSTIFIDQPSRDNVEYAMVKSAGEVLAARLNAEGIVRVVSKRLPRMATDQTITLVSVPVEDSVAVLLESIRAVGATHEGRAT